MGGGGGRGEGGYQVKGAEAEFLDVFGTKVFRVFILARLSHLYKGILHPPPPLLSKSGLKLVCNKTLYTETPSLRTLKIMSRKLNEKLYVHESGFRRDIRMK